MDDPRKQLSAAQVYAGSDGEVTKWLYAELEPLGVLGLIAMNLFRACKASERAKVYRGGVRGRGSFKGMAYEKKEWSLRQLCEALPKSGFKWGWKQDPGQEYHNWVLYVDLPNGQVSFHAAAPIGTAKYEGEWDGKGLSAERVVDFVDAVLASEVSPRGLRAEDGGRKREEIPNPKFDDRALVQAGLFI